MKKMYVFGDSYVAQWNDTGPGWAKLLANKLNIECVNYGVSGSSMEYAMRQFQKCVADEKITDSIIIVLLSTIGRLDFEIQNERPETASPWSHTDDNFVDINDHRNVWYIENKNYIKWYLSNFNYDGLVLNKECYIHAINNFAQFEPSNRVIVLINGTRSESSIIPINKAENLLIPNIDINKISMNEFVDGLTYESFCKYIKWDVRMNHMMIPNLTTMADSIYNIIKTGDTSHLSYDNFKRGVLKQIVNKQELDCLISDGLLYPCTIPRLL
jgi:hypothetical protein